MKLLKTVGLVIAIFFGGLFLIAFLIGFVDGVIESLNEDEQQTSRVETKPEVKVAPPVKDDSQVTLESDKYETELAGAKQTFIDGCAVEGTAESQCACMYDWLDNNLTNAEFNQVIKDSVDGIISDHIWSAAKACVTL